jgi:hypothetical protein
MSAYEKSGLSMEVEMNVKTIYHQALDHRDDRGRKGRDPGKKYSSYNIFNVFCHRFPSFFVYFKSRMGLTF